MRLLSVSLVAAALALAACSSTPESIKVRRDVTMDTVFPDKADQQGLHMASPVQSGMHIVYYQYEVSQAQVDRRMVEYCARRGYERAKFARAPEPTKVKLSEGGEKPAISVWYDCS